MADYMYLLEHRLSAAQQKALLAVREVARAQGVTVFLVGGAVRDLTSGSPVRDLDVAVQGNALQLRPAIEAAGGVITGELKASQALFVRFEGSVRMEIGSSLSASYPKPGKPVYEPATILDDLRRRDFTVNAMALSLNEGSYGLLMDPLNGVADLENRQLRLVSNYGFIEDPVRMVRAARFAARLGWTMDEKTLGRYETGKAENYIKTMDAVHRGYETEEIFHEEDPLRILRKLEEEGWMKHLFPQLTVAKTNVAELEKLREAQTQLQMRGIHPDAAAANFPLLTAKLSATELAELKKSFVRPGFVVEVEALEGEAKEFATLLNGKQAAMPSQAWKLLTTQKPEAVLWVAYSSKSPAIQAKLKSFYTEWPKARQKVPYTLMQEMRIVPELEGFDAIVEKLFYELMDGNLGTVEEMKAWLEQYSPPAPPPPVNLRRARGSKKEAKGRGRRKFPEDDTDEDAEVSVAASEDEADGADEDEVESEEEATEVAPLRSGQVRRIEPMPEPERRAAEEDAPEQEMEPEADKVSQTAVVDDVEVSFEGPQAADEPAGGGNFEAAEDAESLSHSPSKESAGKAGEIAGHSAGKQGVAQGKSSKVGPAAKIAGPVKKSEEAAGRASGVVAVEVVPAKAVAVKAVPAKAVAVKTVAPAAPAKKTAPVVAPVPAKKIASKAPAKKTAPGKAAVPAKKVTKPGGHR